MALTYKQTALIRGTLPMLREHGEQLVSDFYKTMLHDHPELSSYFNTSNQVTGRQPRALVAVLLHFAANINHTSELIPKLERVCNKHCSLSIEPHHYEIVSNYLLPAFARVLGAAMTPEAHEAWHKAYWILARMLIGREAQLYGEFEKWTGWRKFRIEGKVAEADGIWSFRLAPVDGKRLPSFLPGQYVSVQVDAPALGYRQSRQYALSDAPRADHYRITVKRDLGSSYSNSVSSCYLNPGIVSNRLIDETSNGDVVEVSHPAGEFYLDANNPSSVPLVLISAGVGVAPLMSMLNSVAESQPKREVSWIHGSRGGIPFGSHVGQLKRSLPNLRTSLFEADLADRRMTGVPDGCDYRMDLQKVARGDLFLDHGSTEYYICGPEQFMMETKDFLENEGVDRSQAKYGFLGTGSLAFKR